ncbi:TIGR03936 family radical SAM-associated protein [Anaerocolumna xylanovorans]|uniref:Radical SAM-linked protein n=1 Tax=Anaerocolumna xylanovorans DSM 12503 TaxID=1121345 RepID=A0A1M7Y1P9_9FIRM|nr:TIGR03936 family radical SAM-associated protein [Anaerocolumna xylanovorans]SHO45781.1 radical SAM-linked protein [Anaerocolumna xylanovorans DSM 12503]
MMVRMKFIKTGPVKFIGHLDIMRFFQKAVRRAGLDVEYSQGFNPHQVMSFASPLGVGLTSEGEYLDVSFNSLPDKQVLLQKLNDAMNEFIQVTDMVVLNEGAKNAMASVAAADYLVSVKDGYEFFGIEEFQKKFTAFMAQENITILKKSKKSEKETDIRPFIYFFAFTDIEFLGEDSAKKSLAESYDNGVKVYLKLSSGSVDNLKPELVMEAFCEYAGIPYNEFAFQMHRFELYGEAKDRNYIPLSEVGYEA